MVTRLIRWRSTVAGFVVGVIVASALALNAQVTVTRKQNAGTVRAPFTVDGTISDFVVASTGGVTIPFLSTTINVNNQNITNIGQAAWNDGSSESVRSQAFAAGILTLHNSTTNSASLRLFNTRTDANNGEWGAATWDSNTFRLHTNANGTGSTRNLAVAAAGTLFFGAGGALNSDWQLTSSGRHLQPVADNTVDLGAAANALRDIYLDGNLLSGGKAFASLGTPGNGALVYCSDCTIANPCASGGTGAFAKRLNGAWVCN